ncbi:hypothetical protein C095_01370 [Fusobacterium necrophorum subsp. funduliforme B35]|uniref:Uncharacterized protein n=1 Tax=Fusobacterium necrophorum subsp. funduliforme B35 TaxID=1226633 RepID=A0A0B4FRJ3_9FUSO|nr:hypothetical protein C095_01370 [Fusobacterium necrophorum subsp. funduliforme B35]
MIHNLEKNVKGCFKRRVSVTLAALTIFFITGNMGYALAVLPEPYVTYDELEDVYEDVGVLVEDIEQNTKDIEDLDKHLSTTMSDLGKLNRNFDVAKKDIETNKENIKLLDKYLGETSKNLGERIEKEMSDRELKDKVHDAMVEEHNKRLDKIEDTVETHDMAIKGLKIIKQIKKLQKKL